MRKTPSIRVLAWTSLLGVLLAITSWRTAPNPAAAAAPVAQPTPCATQVYSNNFETTVGSEWSVTRAEVTPNGNRRFLGQFGNDTVSLSLANLPQHSQVRVAFDVYVIRTWDGNGPAAEYGPDIFEARVDNGPTLTRTTFTVHSYLRQAYPSEYPTGDNPPRSGTIENNSLGYSFNGTPLSSVYRIEKTVAHTGGALKLNFSASGLEALDNESWGLDNVVVSVDCPPPPCEGQVYANTFEGAVGNEWSTNRTEVTPVGNRRFLGQFVNETASLSLANLPLHTKVTVSFDVYVMRSWDGSSSQWGPDVFDVRAENGPVLTRTTFALQPPLRQAWPGDNATGAGAAETNTLGYRFDGVVKDAVFRVSKTIEHSSDRLKLNFSASGLERLENESWGLDNLSVTVDCPPLPPCTGELYAANFETAVGSEWSMNRTEVTPVGNRRFLGQFSNETVSLSLANIRPHTQVTVAFDVYAIRSLDGNSTQWGPDIFDIRAENGAVVMRSTLSLQNPLRQAYPGEFPGGDNPTGMGAVETNTLGYTFDGLARNAVFRVTRTIPHTGAALKLNFTASGLERIENESWGLDNVSVRIDCPNTGVTDGALEAQQEAPLLQIIESRTIRHPVALPGNGEKRRAPLR
jgi:hypothetical protein